MVGCRGIFWVLPIEPANRFRPRSDAMFPGRQFRIHSKYQNQTNPGWTTKKGWIHNDSNICNFVSEQKTHFISERPFSSMSFCSQQALDVTIFLLLLLLLLMKYFQKSHMRLFFLFCKTRSRPPETPKRTGKH